MSYQMQHNVHCQMSQHNVYSTEIADVLPIFGAPAAGVSPQFVPVTRWTDAAAVISNQIEIHAAAGKRAIDHSLGTAGCNVSHANKRSCPGDVISHTAAVWHHPPCPPKRIAPVCHAEDIRECGYIGVRWSRKKLRWRVRINAEGKVICSHPRARGKRRGFSPGAAARHSQSARVQGRAAAEGFSPTSPRAHWIGPEPRATSRP